MQKSKDSLKDCFENVNIVKMTMWSRSHDKNGCNVHVRSKLLKIFSDLWVNKVLMYLLNFHLAYWVIFHELTFFKINKHSVCPGLGKNCLQRLSTVAASKE